MIQQEVEEIVMESTAQYWKPVWGALERLWKRRASSERRPPAQERLSGRRTAGQKGNRNMRRLLNQAAQAAVKDERQHI
jgi:hypothetical protein